MKPVYIGHVQEDGSVTGTVTDKNGKMRQFKAPSTKVLVEKLVAMPALVALNAFKNKDGGFTINVTVDTDVFPAGSKIGVAAGVVTYGGYAAKLIE